MGGIPNHAAGVGAGLARLAANVRLIGRARPRAVSPYAELAVTVLHPRLTRRLWDLTVVPAYLHRVRAAAFVDVGFSTPAMPGCPTVVVIPDLTPFSRWRFSRASGWILRQVTRDSLRRASHIVFTSQSVRAEYHASGLMRLRPGKAESVVPLGVANDFLRPNIVGGRPDGVLWSGTALPRKDHQTMVEASRLAGITYERLGSDKGVGGPAIAAQLARCEVLVVTSLYEGFSLPVIEARAVGVPVICSDIPVHREVADPESTVFFRPGDAAALAQIFRERPWDNMPRRRSWSRSWFDVAKDTYSIIAALMRNAL